MTPQHTVQLRSPSRLHFGLFSFGAPNCPNRFGGVGCMLRTPELHLKASPAEEFRVWGRHADRVLAFAERVSESLGWSAAPECLLEVVTAPRQHVGLGTGTQLALSVAQVLCAFQAGAQPAVAELAQATGRGKRSSIGILGHERGGLLVDSGRAAGGALGRVEAHAYPPSAWRWVLVIDTQAEGLAHTAEQSAFTTTPPVPGRVTQRLHHLAIEAIVPAAREGDFVRFAEALHEYNVLAGECFAAVQGGPFASARVAALVERIRTLGYAGCGQSSWGPTVFTVTQNDAAAQELVDLLLNTDEAAGCEVMIAEGAVEGAGLVVTEK